MFIEQPPWFYRALFPGVIWRIPAKKKCVYLTFDDGPIPEVTPWVLDILDKYGVKATFFCVGDNVHKHPDIYQMVLDRGHRVGNHTFNHIQGIRFWTKNYLANVEKAAEYIKSDLFRPPHGHMRFPQVVWTQEALPDHHVGRGDARLQSAHDTERCLQRGEELYPQRFRNRLSRLAESRTQHARSDAQGHRMATGTRV